jgi:Thioredoxin
MSRTSSTVVLEGAAKKQDAERVLQKRPLLVLFFMNGCPHCESNKPAWDQAKKKMKIKGGATVAEIEAEATPDSAGVSGFPTMKYIDASGKETVTTGEKQSGDQILKDLGAPSVLNGARRRGTHRRRTRKLRHRTLRNYVSLRK